MDVNSADYMAMLNELMKMQNAEKNTDDTEIFVSSFRDAMALLKQHMSPSGARYRKNLVEYIINPENRVFDKCDVYHNFVMDLFRVGDFDLAIQFCDYVLEQAPFNRDILADVIKACGDSSQFEKGEKYLKRAMKIPCEKWSYRLFLYSIDFLKTKLSAYPMKEEIYELALSLAGEYIKYFPFDEHGYNQKAELLILMNHRDEAIAVLKQYIFETHPDVKNRESELITAQCCATLLSLLDDSNDYSFIINICEKGLRNTAQEQPSANIGFFVYRKALALDAKAHTESLMNADTINDAMRLYQIAYDLNNDGVWRGTIEKRYAVLRPYSTNGQPLVRRMLFVIEESKD